MPTDSKSTKLRFQCYVPRSEELKKYIVPNEGYEEATKIIQSTFKDAEAKIKNFNQVIETAKLIAKPRNTDLKRVIENKDLILEHETIEALKSLRKT